MVMRRNISEGQKFVLSSEFFLHNFVWRSNDNFVSAGASRHVGDLLSTSRHAADSQRKRKTPEGELNWLWSALKRKKVLVLTCYFNLARQPVGCWDFQVWIPVKWIRWICETFHLARHTSPIYVASACLEMFWLLLSVCFGGLIIPMGSWLITDYIIKIVINAFRCLK